MSDVLAPATHAERALGAEDARDSALWQQYRQGDRAAFAELHGHYRLPLFRFLHRILLGVGGAEDVYQEVWLQIVERGASFRLDGSFRVWLFTVARSRALDRRRRDGVHARHLVDRAGSEPAGGTLAQPDQLEHLAGGDEPTAARLQLERARLLASALAAVPETQREVFLLHEEAELPLPEVARVLGIPYEAVKSRYRYALARLRTHFGVERETRHGG